MKNILVPCDFSNPSQEAFRFATDIAAKSKGEVTVLHALFIPVLYDPSYGGGMPLGVDPTFLTDMEEDTKKRFEKMKGSLPGSIPKISLVIVKTDVLSAVKQIISSGKIDLIVMGTVGTTGLQEIFIGSTTEKVVRHSSVPVFVVRTAPKVTAIKKILLPTTLAFDQTNFINKVKELQEFLHASLEVLLINTPYYFMRDADAKEALEEFAAHYKLSNYNLHFRNYRNEEEGITDFSNEVDLIAMATHARKGLAHLFNGSITENVVNHIECPVWTYCLN